MQMIDVLKRLAELDAQNPNIVKEAQDYKDGEFYIIGDKKFGQHEVLDGPFPDEGAANAAKGIDGVIAQWKNGNWDFDYMMDPNQNVAGGSSVAQQQPGLAESLQECGMMGGMSQPHSHTPATINMTADSGAELTGMLKDIMQLAGLRQVTPHDLGHEHEPAVLSTEPGMSVSKVDSEPLDMKSMIAKIDTLNDPGEDDEEAVKEYSNSPAKDINGDMDNEAMLNTAMHNHDQSGGQDGATTQSGERRNTVQPAAYESLMAEYKKFISEN